MVLSFSRPPCLAENIFLSSGPLPPHSCWGPGLPRLRRLSRVLQLRGEGQRSFHLGTSISLGGDNCLQRATQSVQKVSLGKAAGEEIFNQENTLNLGKDSESLRHLSRDPVLSPPFQRGQSSAVGTGVQEDETSSPSGPQRPSPLLKGQATSPSSCHQPGVAKALLQARGAERELPRRSSLRQDSRGSSRLSCVPAHCVCCAAPTVEGWCWGPEPWSLPVPPRKGRRPV